jgi:NADPH:quinone reductase-like Zn-dependent oxidoreductase
VLPALKRGGTLVTIAGQPDEAKARDLGVNIARFSAQVNTELLNTFAQLIDNDQIKPFVGATFSLSEASKAHALSESGHGRGRIVIHIS